MRLEECPVEESKNYRDCRITRDCLGSESHEIRGIRCPIDWWVCPVCLPNHCPKMIPENPNPIIGKIVWVV